MHQAATTYATGRTKIPKHHLNYINILLNLPSTASNRVNLEKFLTYSDQLNSPKTESNAQCDVEAKRTFTRPVLNQIVTYLCSKSQKSTVTQLQR